MAGLALVTGLVILVVAFLIVGSLARIADAIEKQNDHYGIGHDVPDAPAGTKEEGAA